MFLTRNDATVHVGIGVEIGFLRDDGIISLCGLTEFRSRLVCLASICSNT